MKKLFCLLLVLMLFPVLSFADPGVVLSYRMNLYGSQYNEDHPGSLPFDTMMIDVYLMDDFNTAYYCKTIWSDGNIDTTGYAKCTVSDGDNSRHVLTFDNGEVMSFYYDENNAFWLEMENGTYHLLPCERFDLRSDLK